MSLNIGAPHLITEVILKFEYIALTGCLFVKVVHVGDKAANSEDSNQTAAGAVWLEFALFFGGYYQNISVSGIFDQYKWKKFGNFVDIMMSDRRSCKHSE